MHFHCNFIRSIRSLVLKCLINFLLIRPSSDKFLTLRPPIITKVSYANSLDPDETLSNSASHPYPSCLAPRKHFHHVWAILKHFEFTQIRTLADDTLLGGLRIKFIQTKIFIKNITLLSNSMDLYRTASQAMSGPGPSCPTIRPLYKKK